MEVYQIATIIIIILSIPLTIFLRRRGSLKYIPSTLCAIFAAVDFYISKTVDVGGGFIDIVFTLLSIASLVTAGISLLIAIYRKSYKK
jgi:hypothetical protein